MNDSDTFELLVKSENDVVGLLAFARSKQEERNWVRNHPDDPVYHPPRTPEDVRRHRRDADEALKVFAESIVNDLASALTKEVESSKIVSIVADIRNDIRLQGSLRSQIPSSVVGSFIYSLIMLLLLILANTYGSDLMKPLDALANHQRSTTVPSPNKLAPSPSKH